jgi:3-oxoacyl-[acyl-carrier protein] reductase
VPFDENGADLALTFQHPNERAQRVVRSIEQLGRRAAAIQADSADPAAIRRSIDDAVGALGGLHILVKNAAIALYDTIADFKVHDIDALLAVNVRGPVLATQAALPHLGAGGRVIRIGSAGADRVVGATGTVYSMTKAALQAFTRGPAHELGPRDITANLVQPGSTDTEMNPADGEFSDSSAVSFLQAASANQPTSPPPSHSWQVPPPVRSPGPS